MKILSIETSGPLCAAAISHDGQLIAEYSARGGNIHDKLCAEFVRRALDDQSMSVNDLDAVAISAGPGSFTGLRIGVSIAKALCFKQTEKEPAPKFIAVPTLSAFAYAASEFALTLKAKKIIAAIPAQKEIIYYQLFDNDGNEASEIKITDKDEFNQLDKKKTIFCGPYAPDVLMLSPQSLKEYSIKFTAALALRMFMENKFSDPKTFNPEYIQEFNLKSKRKILEI